MDLTERIEELFDLAKAEKEREHIIIYRQNGKIYLDVGNYEWGGYDVDELIDYAKKEMMSW